MYDSLFRGLFDSDLTAVISLTDFLLCIFTALAAGLIIALSYMYKNRYTKSFVVTLAMLPSVVCVVIMMVNGNVGTGVAVAGAFSLVRFRSVPGTAREIVVLFMAMGAGLIAGMGYIGFALVFTCVICSVFLIYSRLDFGVQKNSAAYQTVSITIPEDLDYTNVFDEVFEQYASSWTLVRVKTTNMGSLFKLKYDVVLKDISKEKELIDNLRCRNCNLEITISRQETSNPEL